MVQMLAKLVSIPAFGPLALPPNSSAYGWRAAADGENDSPNCDGSSKFSKEIKRPIGESAEKQSASKPNQIIQPTVLFDCGMLPLLAKEM